MITPLSHTAAKEEGREDEEEEVKENMMEYVLVIPIFSRSKPLLHTLFLPSFLSTLLVLLKGDNGLNIQYISECRLSFHTL